MSAYHADPDRVRSDRTAKTVIPTLNGAPRSGVAGAGPAVYLLVAGVLALSALLAGLGPSVRAGRVDPAEILRSEG